jgi:hypothetical protein
MKKKKTMNTKTVVVETVIEQVIKQLGRPVNPNSARQQRIAELEAKRADGQCKRGRPTVAGSKRQEVLAARAAKVANGGMLSKGRPVNPNSKRQMMLAAKVQAPETVNA